jgi:propionyl-CoA synthetase
MAQSRYDSTYATWQAAPVAFWATAAERLEWTVRGATAFDPDQGLCGRWFPGWQINACDAAVDRHVRDGRGDQAALIYDSPVSGQVRTYTFAELQDHAARCAGALKALGIGKGDRVIIYMPMIPEAVIAMLAVARLGAVHSVVFGGFAAHELAARIDDSTPKVIIAATCGIEPGRLVAYKPLLEAAIAEATHKPDACLIVARPGIDEGLDTHLVPGERDFAALVAVASPVPPVPVDATDLLYILYTSGTTGKPKGVVRDVGGYLVALSWSMEAIYGVKPGETFWAASDIGWVVGHSYIVYGPLVHGCATVLYEGKPVGTPDAGAFWRVAAQHKVSVLFTAPTAIRAIKREDSAGEHLARHDVSGLRALFLAGERADPETVRWAETTLGRPVIDHWWQTELGWPALSGYPGLDDQAVRHGSAGRPAPGYRFKALDEAGHSVAPGENGALVIELPLAPGCMPTLWNGEDRFHDGYLSAYPGHYLTGDAGHVDADGYVWVMGRTDDVINVAGHRLSTGQMEEVLATHPAVAECAVVGIADSFKGQVPMGFVVLKAGADGADVERELVAAVRDAIGPVAAFKDVAVVSRLPKTRSGKILRATMRKIADNQPWTMPPTIEDPTALHDVEAIMSARKR